MERERWKIVKIAYNPQSIKVQKRFESFDLVNPPCPSLGVRVVRKVDRVFLIIRPYFSNSRRTIGLCDPNILIPHYIKGWVSAGRLGNADARILMDL
jgi:hypothetical protein